MTGDEKHSWAAASTLHVLWVVSDRVLNVSPGRLDDPDRDRFLLSKGHGPMAFYAVLAAKGFLDTSVLDSWTTFGSPLGQHPDRVLVPGAEIGSDRSDTGWRSPSVPSSACARSNVPSHALLCWWGWGVGRVQQPRGDHAGGTVGLAAAQHLIRSLGVRRDAEQRVYGEPADHDALHGLDVTRIAAEINSFPPVEST